MATYTRHEILKSVAQQSTGRKALLVTEVALGIVLAGVVFAAVERNVIAIGAQAVPEKMQSGPTITSGSKATKSVRLEALPAEVWYTPAQYQNQATEIEPLPSQF